VGSDRENTSCTRTVLGMESGCIGALFRTSAQSDYNAALVSRFQYRRTLTSSAADWKWFLSHRHSNLGEPLRSSVEPSTRVDRSCRRATWVHIIHFYDVCPWVKVYWLEEVCRIVSLESVTEAWLDDVSKPDRLVLAT